VGLKKGQWTEEEDELVRSEVDKAGGALFVKWNDVAEVVSGRLGKQVRERWQNHLDPALCKEPWDEAEDQLLISLQAVMGNKWSEIARAFAGRSENSVKNRWNSKQRKSLAAERKLRTGSELGVLVRPRLAATAFGALSTGLPSTPAACSRPSGGGQPAPQGASAEAAAAALFSPHGSATIKIDFGKALEAAHSPHVATAAESKRLGGASRAGGLGFSPMPVRALSPVMGAALGLSGLGGDMAFPPAARRRDTGALVAAAAAIEGRAALVRSPADEDVKEASQLLLALLE